MRFDEQEIFVMTKEDLRQVTADVPVVMQRQVLVIQRVQKNSGRPTGPVHLHARVVLCVGEAQVTIEYVPQVMAEIVEVVRLIPQECVHQRTSPHHRSWKK